MVQVSVNPNPTKEQMVHGVQCHFLSQVLITLPLCDRSALWLAFDFEYLKFYPLYLHDHPFARSNWTRCRWSRALFMQQRDWRLSTPKNRVAANQCGPQSMQKKKEWGLIFPVGWAERFRFRFGIKGIFMLIWQRRLLVLWRKVFPSGSRGLWPLWFESSKWNSTESVHQ